MAQFIPEHTPSHLNYVTQGYLDCAEWLLDEEIDRDGIIGWSDSAIARAIANCKAFRNDVGSDFDLFCAEYRVKGNYDVEECFGHDFFLTRNHHGAGFWDRNLGDLGDRLTAAARKFGETDVCLGDNGLLYFA